MTAAWFEIDPEADRMPPPIADRYRLRDPWGDYARPGEVIPICFAGTTQHGRALVTGHTDHGQAIILPLDPAVVIIHSDPPIRAQDSAMLALPARAASGFATGGEAS